MYPSQHPWVELYHALLAYEGEDVYTHLLQRWPRQHPDEVRWLAEFSRRADCCPRDPTDEDLCRLYAVSRVTSILLLRFQSGRADGTDYPGPAVTPEGYQLFHEALGFRVEESIAFHPFYHEIIGVRPAEGADEPIELIDQDWPPLMLGRMMFARAGCLVSGGANHVVKSVAERSRLFWAFRRKDRPYEDLSHEWGMNSQWRTRPRRDYWSPFRFHYNLDAADAPVAAMEPRSGVDVGTMTEVVRHRCRVRSAADDDDLFPYVYSLEEPCPDHAFDPSWRTETVLALARALAVAGDVGVAPILADALEEAGCDDPDVLDHLRGPGPHSPGCWAAAEVLGTP